MSTGENNAHWWNYQRYFWPLHVNHPRIHCLAEMQCDTASTYKIKSYIWQSFHLNKNLSFQHNLFKYQDTVSYNFEEMVFYTLWRTWYALPHLHCGTHMHSRTAAHRQCSKLSFPRAVNVLLPITPIRNLHTGIVCWSQHAAHNPMVTKFSLQASIFPFFSISNMLDVPYLENRT